MKAIYIAIVLAGAVLLLAGCTTDYPQPPTADEVKAYREWKEKSDSDEFFGRTRGPGIGPFAF
jgi:outer membrane biogenesis lipoprotein LolB